MQKTRNQSSILKGSSIAKGFAPNFFEFTTIPRGLQLSHKGVCSLKWRHSAIAR